MDKDLIRIIGIGIGVIGGIFGISALGARGCNCAFNNKTVNKPNYTHNSYVKGLTGHIEYTRYSDGYQDIKIYPGWGHRLFSSELIQDFGDGKVDIIREHGPELKMNRSGEILVRKSDYESHKERFDEADKLLQKLMEMFPIKD